MFTIKSVALETVCGVTSKLPATQLPEFAFAGKSNVGKSTLINGLMNRKSLARTSAQPGKTQTINYYNINNQLYFVDLPGYGYTKANIEAKAKWGKMVENYLHKSSQLKLLFLLIDIRHPPSDNDRQMCAWVNAQSGITPVIIATKADKIKRSQIEKQLKTIRDGLALPAAATVIPYSSLTKQGREEIYAVLEGYLPS
jgi:GTP-binding protein